MKRDFCSRRRAREAGVVGACEHEVELALAAAIDYLARFHDCEAERVYLL